MKMKKTTYLVQSENQERVLEDVRIFLADSIYDYPRHDEWYRGIMREFSEGFDREMIVAYDGKQIAGVSILKRSPMEKKICSLRVAKEYRGNGLGTALFKRSLDYLETDKPILTVSQNKRDEFQKIFKYFGFSLERVYPGKYRAGLNEYCYNGILLPENILKQKENGLGMYLNSRVPKGFY